MKKLVSLSLLGLLIFISCQKDVSKTEQQQNDVVSKNSVDKTNASAEHLSAAVATDWYKLTVDILLHANPATNNALNIEAYGYIGIGLYESVRSGIKNSISLSKSLYQMPAMPEKDNNGYDLTASANAAIASLVRSMFPGFSNAAKLRVDSLENAYNANLLLSMESTKFQRSQEYGRAVAAAVSAWAKTDNFNVSNAGYVPPVSPPGVWVPTPPAFASTPALPFVSSSRPLVFEHGSGGIVPPLPFAYSELPTSDFYKMVKDVYDVSTTSTPDQKVMALYWNDVGVDVGYTPAGHIMNVITQAIEQNGVDLGTAADAYAKAGIALRDATLVCFRSKYQYNLIRPVSYINKIIDKNWATLIPTPVHPEYPSAHAFLTGATMRAALHVLGPIPVVDHSYDFRGFAPRHFATLDAAGDEAGASRRFGGIHYTPSIIAGWTGGRIVGDRVGNLKLHD